MKERTFKEGWLDHMKWFYGPAYEAFSAQDPHDDRRIYINTYNMIVEAIKSLPDEPNNYVCVALNRLMDEDLEVMRDIGKRFGREDYIFKAK